MILLVAALYPESLRQGEDAHRGVMAAAMGVMGLLGAAGVLAGVQRRHRASNISDLHAMAAQQRLTGPAAVPPLFRALQAARLYPDSKTLA